MKKHQLIAGIGLLIVIIISCLLLCQARSDEAIGQEIIKPAKWEQIDKHTSRMWIPEGWIVRCLSSYETGNHFIVAKDPKHIWEVNQLGGKMNSPIFDEIFKRSMLKTIKSDIRKKRKAKIEQFKMKYLGSRKDQRNEQANVQRLGVS